MIVRIEEKGYARQLEGRMFKLQDQE